MTSISLATSGQVSPAFQQPDLTQQNSSESFANHLKSIRDQEPEQSEPAPRKLTAKEQEKEQPRKRESHRAHAAVAVPVSQQLQDLRDLLSAAKRPADSSVPPQDGEPAQAAAPAEDPSAHALQKTQIAFSITIPQRAAGAQPAAVPSNDIPKATHAAKNLTADAAAADGTQIIPSVKAADRQTQAVVMPVHAVSAAATVTVPTPQVAATYAAHGPAKVAENVSTARTAEIDEAPKMPAIRPQSIDLRVAGADNREVDVRVSQRAGDVQITVRTPDNDLAQSLRHHLPELSDRLAQTGVQGDILHTGAGESSNTANDNSDNGNSDYSQGQSQQQQQRQPDSRADQQNEQQGRQSGWQRALDKAETEGR